MGIYLLQTLGMINKHQHALANCDLKKNPAFTCLHSYIFFIFFIHYLIHFGLVLFELHLFLVLNVLFSVMNYCWLLILSKYIILRLNQLALNRENKNSQQTPNTWHSFVWFTYVRKIKARWCASRDFTLILISRV